MVKKNYFLKWAGVFIAILLLVTTMPINAKESEHELPDYLANTILDGSLRVLVTIDGLPVDFVDPEEYDTIISLEELIQIEIEARASYFDLYGIDVFEDLEPVTFGDVTYPPDIENIDSQFDTDALIKFITSEDIYSEQIIINNENNKMIKGFQDDESCMVEPGFYDPPYQIDGKLNVLFVTPANGYRIINFVIPYISTIIGGSRFERFNSVNDVRFAALLNDWYCGDIPYGLDLQPFIDDLRVEYRDYVDDPDEEANVIVAGWLSIINGRNGIGGGHFTVCNYPAIIEHPPISLFQHEMSHCFGAGHHPNLPWPLGALCPMNYFYVPFHWGLWGDDCKNAIQSNLQGP